jgi:hypothetical protein
MRRIVLCYDVPKGKHRALARALKALQATRLLHSMYIITTSAPVDQVLSWLKHTVQGHGQFIAFEVNSPRT